jgi:glycosyltransferase involved in cell wall biosynthesis
MRVLYLAPSGRRAGQLSRYTFLDEEIRALADAGIEAFVISTHVPDFDEGRLHLRAVPEGSARERLRTLEFLARHLPDVPSRNLADWYQCYHIGRIERFAAEVIERERIELIHSYFGWPGGFGGLLARAATGRPLVAGLRGCDVNMIPELRYGSRLQPFFDRAFRRLLGRADSFLYVSEFLRRHAQALGAPPERGRVLLKGVRLDTFTADRRQQAREVLGLGTRPMILAAGGLKSIKGVHHTLEALASLRTMHDFEFIICGDGQEREALEQLAEQLGIGNRTSFRGSVSRADITQYFAAADVFVHGAVIEASGNVLLEAMACGLPIVCTDAGGPAEYVLDGVTGYVVPVGDPASMAARVAELLADPGLRRSFGARGRSRAETELGYERMIEDTITAYRDCLGTGEAGHYGRVSSLPEAV